MKRVVSFVVMLLLSVLIYGGLSAPPASADSAVQITAGLNFSCLLTSSGVVECWGTNSYGQLGDGTTTNHSTPQPIAGGHSFTKIAAGNLHVCGVSGGNVYCWGSGGNGVLGTGNQSDSYVPVQVSGSFTAIDVALPQDSTSCLLTSAGAAYCWGFGADGRLGTGGGNTFVPTAVSGGHVFTSISFGTAHGCGITATGDMWCWGRNDGGNLGNGTTSNSNAPVLVSGGLSFKFVTTGYMSTCALLTSNSASYCWGGGVTTPTLQSWVPIFSSLDISGNTTCGVTTTGDAYCFGAGTSGQIGNNTSANNSTPALVSGNMKWVSIRAQGSAECGLTNASQVYCWGTNSVGLGDAATTTLSKVPLAIWASVTGNVVASATIDASLTFVVAQASGACNGITQTSGTSVSATSVTLAHVTSGSVNAAQSLSVVSNAGSGFTVQVRGSSLTSASGASIATVSGTNAAPAAFGVTPAFGYSVGDVGVAQFAGPLWAALSTSNATVLAGTGSDTGCVDYQALVGATSPAGSYSATVIYTAIPVF